MILILGAMDEEIVEHKSHLENPQKHSFFIGDYYVGKLHGRDVIVAKTGISKTLAAITVQYFLDKFDISHVIFTGIAGSMSKDVRICDVVVGTSLVFCDLDTTAFGDPLGEVPRTGLRFIQSDTFLVKILQDYVNTNKSPHKVAFGLIGTQDAFMHEKEAKAKVIKNFPDILAIEMEGCAVALTCKMQNIPFVVIRAISDNAEASQLQDGVADAPTDFNAFLTIASQENFKMMSYLVKNIK